MSNANGNCKGADLELVGKYMTQGDSSLFYVWMTTSMIPLPDYMGSEIDVTICTRATIKGLFATFDVVIRLRYFPKVTLN